ncbi:MAG TPA: hypothetical protein VLH38_05370 [Patescibacteria group bacterium]|nr:hypothetical protein [Patescibacteria group bacterium]
MDLTTFRKPNPSKIILCLSFGLLAAATLFCAWYANYYLSGNADDIIYPYLFQRFKLHDMILPGQHSNILKFPLFILQAILPYTFATFTVVSIGLVILTILGWATLLVWLFGKRWAPLICLSLASILLGSRLFNYDILGTTIRNIEFPIVFAFVIYAGSLLRKRVLSKAELLLGGTIGFLFSLTIAGDSFFLYVICSSLFVTLAYFWFVGEKGTKQSLQFKLSFVYVAGATVLALAIRVAIKLLGITQYFTAGVFKPHILALNHLSPSLSTTATQILDLCNANIFGQQIAPSTVLVFLNFTLLALGLVGIGCMLCDTFCAHGRKILRTRVHFPRVFIFAVLALSLLVTLAIYVASDLVVGQAPDGTVSSLYQERYLTIVPLLVIVGLVYFVWRNFARRQLVFLGLPILIVIALAISGPGIMRNHSYDGSLRDGPIAVASAAKKHHIQLLVTGYWYGSTTRFWSHDTVNATSVAGCNIPQPTFNTRLSWYKIDPAIHSTALVVVHKGVDAGYWTCSDDQLVHIYGTPAKIIQVNTGDQPDLWLYNYDVRSKIVPMNY